MKIVQINTVYKNGGSTGRIVYDLKRITAEAGHDAYVTYGYEYEKTHDTNTFMMESIPELKASILKTRLFAEHGFYNIRQTKRLLNWLDKLQPDVIHLHNLHNHYLNVEMLFNYIKTHDLPIVWTLHDCWPFTGWCAYFDYTGCDKWKNGCGKCPNKKEYPFTWFFDKSASNYSRKMQSFQGVKNLTIVTPSEWLKGLVGQSFLCEYPAYVINNGIDLGVFKPTESDFRGRYGIGRKKMILAVSMGAAKRKGVEHIYALAEKINKDEEVIVMVGLAKEQIEKLPNGIIGVTRTNSTNELAEAYSAADVFINPTLEDNFPTTNLEALACGTPVVTYKTGGSPESIEEGCGIVVEKGNLEEFYEAVEKLFDNGKNSSFCTQVANRKFDKNKCFNQYIALYRKVAGEK